MEDFEERKNESKTHNPLNEIDYNLYNVIKSICKIITNQKEGTGFLIKLYKNNNEFFCLITKEHIVTQNMIDTKQKIFVFYDTENKNKEIILDKNERYIKQYRNIKLDLTIIEILKKDNIKNKYFLLPYIGDYNIINKNIYIVQFPGGKLSYSKCKVLKIDNYEITHDASTSEGSSGSPIFLENSKGVIGIHKQGNNKKKINYGDFIYPMIKDLESNDNVILYVNEINNIYDINGNIKYLDEIECDEDNGLVHFQKINIIGNKGVGKSTLISLFENYDKLEGNIEIKNKNIDDALIIENSNYSENETSLVEKVSNVEIKMEENKYLYYNFYESDLDNIDLITSYLDILLIQSECIIIIFDKDNIHSIIKIERLISWINKNISTGRLRDFPIILFQNNIKNNDFIPDIDIDKLINKLKSENKNIIFENLEISNKDYLTYFLLKINHTIKNYEIKKKEEIRNNDIVNIVKFVKFNQKSVDTKEFGENYCLCLLLDPFDGAKNTFFNNFSDDTSLSTIGVSSLNIFAKVYGEKLLIKIYNTAGQEKCENLGYIFLRGIDVIAIFYDVNTYDSYEKAAYRIVKIKEQMAINHENHEIILIENIVDSKKRVVNKEDAINFAILQNINYFGLSSSFVEFNAYELLNEIIFLAYKAHKDKKEKNSTTSEGKIILRDYGRKGSVKKTCV